MELEALIEEVYDDLLKEAEDIIEYSHLFTHNNTRGKAEEPDFIATLVTKSIPELANAWGRILEQFKISLSIAAVYCHQTPTVDIKQKPNPELGDLLIVHIHHPAKGKTRRQAVLLQAKMAKKTSVKIDKADMHQLKLYSEWPAFTYIRGKKGKQRNVRPKGPHNGGRYLLISNGGLFSSSPPAHFLTAKAKKVLVYDDTLASEITKMLIMERGRNFQSRSTSIKKDNWSTVVWDILELAFQARIQRSNSKQYKTTEKIQGDTRKIKSEIFCFGPLPSIFREFGEADKENEKELLGNYIDEVGISTIFIETSDLGSVNP